MPPDSPIQAKLRFYNIDDLTLGLDVEKVSFCWRPYEERSPEARAAYDKLRDSIRRDGLLHPIIAWRGHVLVGQRRVEICRTLGHRVIPAYEITEDVSNWDRWDIKRLNRFKERMYGSSLQQFMG